MTLPRLFSLAVFNRPVPARIAIQELDSVLEAVWSWEVANHGKPETRFTGRAVFEAVMELQEWIIAEGGK